MRIEKKTLNWFPKASTWDHQQSLNAKRKAQAQSYMADQSSLATSIFNATDINAAGEVNNAIQAAVARLQNKTA